jgi:hypothetical protein
MAGVGKPLDLGTGVVCASFAAGGSWLSIGTVHPAHGFVELNALPRLDERERGDPIATRRHRAAMTDERFAFLAISPAAADGRPGPAGLTWAGRSAAGDASAPASGRTVAQRWWFARPRARVRFAGVLDRPALAEITELDPPPPTGASTRLVADGPRLLVLAEALPAAAVIEASSGRWELDGPGMAELLVPGQELELRVAVAPTVRPPQLERVAPAPENKGAPAPSVTTAPAVVARALAYVRGCTALATGDTERVILTDHRILPLSWTRDAYYQALLLLSTGDAADRERVADHLRWLWTRCERPDGRWVRAHHANGRRKDLAFQADQQLYPMIELADYWRAARELPRGMEWSELVSVAWRAALDAVDGTYDLIASTENAADDPAVAPFMAAAQIVLWYAAQRLAQIAGAVPVGLEQADLRAVAVRVRHGFERQLVSDGRWAYATDGAGRNVSYHDANDLPVALAPLWGFCGADDPAWLATMDFAFSNLNPGYARGRRAGLGSGHTPGAWSLGDVQAWAGARARGDATAAAAALERLSSIAFGDGMLPEAYATQGALRRVRHWFAWPGAAIAALLLLDRADLLEARLAAP